MSNIPDPTEPDSNAMTLRLIVKFSELLFTLSKKPEFAILNGQQTLEEVGKQMLTLGMDMFGDER